ncbi:MAG: hypothetical protein Q9217_004581 [Psora testacea]
MEKDRGVNTLIEGPFNVEAQAKIEDLTRSPLAENNPPDLLNYMPEAFNFPQRIVLRFHVKFEREEKAIIDIFFASYGLDPIQDYYSHLCAPNESSIMHIVLDLHCKRVPTVDLRAVEHKVFKVRKSDNLSVFLSFGDTQLISNLVVSVDNIANDNKKLEEKAKQLVILPQILYDILEF